MRLRLIKLVVTNLVNIQICMNNHIEYSTVQYMYENIVQYFCHTVQSIQDRQSKRVKC